MPSKSDHELIPVHELMTDKEVNDLFKKLGIVLRQFTKDIRY